VSTEVPEHEIPEDVRALCLRLNEAGERAWVVGGCLRNILLGQRVADWDLATSAEPRRVQRLFRRVIPTGIDHGTVTVIFRGEPYEVTTLRGEGAYTDGRRPEAVFFVSEIEDDLARRDFTVNAIAYDPISKALIDPFGGLEDLERRILRAVGSPLERFSEDGLRILRGARFLATLEGFTLEAETEAAFRPTLPTFAKVSHERVRDEWMKAMGAAHPSRAFEVMARTGILDVTLPELAELGRREARAFECALAATDACHAAPPNAKIVRHAALLSRLGEPEEAARIADRFLRDYRYSTDERTKVVHLLRQRRVAYDPSLTDADIRRFVQRVGPDHLEDLFELLRAAGEAEGDPRPAWIDALSARCEGVRDGLVLSPKDLAITGNDLMNALGTGPGPHLGEILRILVERVTDDPSQNRAEALLALASALESEAREAMARRKGRG
jgi:tRNA nucleotidyltransferase (CCA-adding enzyme)